MKSISSLIKWILFVPVCLLSVIISLFNGLYPGSVAEFFATNRNGVAEIIAFSVLGLFLVSFVISLFDRKVSPVHMLHKNYFCGVTSVGAALAMAANAAFEVTNMINSSDPIRVIPVITVFLTGLSGITMLYLGLNHFSGKNSTKNISLIYLSMPLWCGAHLIDRFLNNTATPVAAGDSLDLIMFVAMAMFFINATMIHSVISVKNSVKSAINFGLPTVVISLVYCVNLIFEVVNSEVFVALELIPAIAYGFIALYVMGFVAELSFKAKTVDEQVVVTDEDDAGKDIPNEYYDEEETSEEEEDESSSEASEDASDDFDSSEYAEDNTSLEENFNEEESSEETAFNHPFVYDIRVAEDDDEDVPVGLDDDIDFSDDEENVSEDNVADELFKAAKQQDDKKTDKNEADESGSDKEMILDDNSKRVDPSYAPDTKEDKPHGPTKREAIMYDDEEFILSVDTGLDGDSASENKDASFFILDSEDSGKEVPAKKSYEERLDEIDKLIISIQGGDAPEDQ